MAEVLIKGVHKSYGNVAAIKGIDAAVADGELMVLLGPSGCGKSTLLRMVAGLEEITAGDIAIGGRVVNRLEPKDRNVAMVFQNYALYPHMSVFDNMAYGLRIAGLKRAEIDRRVRAAADMLELAGLLARKPRQLSGGQRQRVAMGRAIVREPAVFLFDEPLSNLDAKLRTQMRVEIKRLQRRLGVTSLYVTHDQVEAMTLADRIMVMNAGLAEQIGTPMEIYRRPATLFVAGFVGAPAMNFLPGRIADGGAAVAIEGGPALPLPAPHAAQAGRPVIVGLRPEHLAPAEAPLNSRGFPAVVELVEALGADTLVHARLAGGAILLARLADGGTIPEGTAIALLPRSDELHLFDKQSGRRLEP